jgi:SPP1 gp7 family putative phage head morphogenesis protein
MAEPVSVPHAHGDEPAESVNAQLADAFTARSLQVGRAETGERQEVWAVLLLLEQDLLHALREADPAQFSFLVARRRAVQFLVRDEIDPLVTTRYAQIARDVDAFLVALAEQEARVTRRIVNTTTEARTVDELPSETVLRRAVRQTLIPSVATPTELSTTGEDWWERQATGLVQRLGDSLMVGVGLEEPTPTLVARVQGTAANGFQDGIMAKAKEDAARLLRTQTTNAVSEARVKVADVNAGALLIEHSSVLDSRTSSICLGRHGLRYTVPEHEPVNHSVPYLNGPPYHPNCRSSMITIVPGGGRAPQDSVSSWLARRDTAFQDAVLGPTRARMFRAGTLTPHQLIEAATGKPLTLEELGA